MFLKPRIVRKVRKHRLTYLEPNALNDIHAAVSRLEQDHIAGIFLEAGCALGGSAIVIASAKSTARPFFVYDLFGMIPPPSEKDGMDVQQRFAVIKDGMARGIKGDRYYGYEDNLYQKVQDNFREFGLPVERTNTHLVRGLYQDTLQIDQPVAFAHIDCDWYESVMTCLQNIEPQMVKGGVMVVDDYFAWSGCRRAIDEYFKDRGTQYKFTKKSRLHIMRI